MIDALASAAGAFNSVASGISTLKDIADPTKRVKAEAELLSQLIALQTAFQIAQSEYEVTKKEVIQLKEWGEDKARYELKRLVPGINIYSVKEDQRGTEPPHDICADCYNNNRKSLLHITARGNGLTVYECRACGSRLEAGIYEPPRQAASYGPDDWMR